MRRWRHAHLRIRLYRLRGTDGGPPELHRPSAGGMSAMRRKAPEALFARGDRLQRLRLLLHGRQEEVVDRFFFVNRDLRQEVDNYRNQVGEQVDLIVGEEDRVHPLDDVAGTSVNCGCAVSRFASSRSRLSAAVSSARSSPQELRMPLRRSRRRSPIRIATPRARATR